MTDLLTDKEREEVHEIGLSYNVQEYGRGQEAIGYLLRLIDRLTAQKPRDGAPGAPDEGSGRGDVNNHDL